ncbi:Restriction endonuclease [Blastococcus aggregatus]|uniref:Restriction endonuclease n=2 Tax=Blastococcus aggregatus TaxID=38502 RepID=A0A285VA67_9ACTN|nr:Restriction endonuclease [Blastococcus aggregatus]
MGGMPAWADYQEEAALFFRSLGLTASTNETIEGIRGRHAVDVAVRGQRAGQQLLWIVECKRWKTRVSKLHVAALISIVDDVGADRGILLSEAGFQSGAVALATRSNIRLTSLAELRGESTWEYEDLQFNDYRRRLAQIEARLQTFTVTRGNTSRTRKGIDGDQLLRGYAMVSTAQRALDAVHLNRWPIPYGLSFGTGDSDDFLAAASRSELVDGLGLEVDKAEALSLELEAKVQEW